MLLFFLCRALPAPWRAGQMAVVGNPDVSGNRSIAAVFANDFW